MKSTASRRRFNARPGSAKTRSPRAPAGDGPLLLAGATVVTGGKVLPGAPVLIAGGKIAAVGKAARAHARGARRVDLAGRILAPGFVDLHTHGAVGVDFVVADRSAFERAMGHYLARGVTALLVSIYPGPTEEMAAALVRIAGFIRERAGGGPAIGIHLEGPYLSLAKPGALPAEHFRVYRKSELDLLLDAADGFVKTMTLAPELPGGPALIRHLLRRGVVPSFGHSDAGYDEARQAIAAGVRHATHLFNAMHGIHHRGPGPVVAFLEDDRAHVELIADGFHVQVPVLKLVHAVKARERVILVSDSVEACGLAEGPHSFAGKRVELRGGRVTLPDGTLAGSALTLDHAVALHRRELGLPAAEAVLLASGNPAALLGDRKRGEIAPGRRADLVLLDPALKVLATWLGGTQVWGKRM